MSDKSEEEDPFGENFDDDGSYDMEKNSPPGSGHRKNEEETYGSDELVISDSGSETENPTKPKDTPGASTSLLLEVSDSVAETSIPPVRKKGKKNRK